jgi:arsenate reductase
MTEMKKKILFLCSGNSVRSQMVEGLMTSLGSDQWDVKSGGTFLSYVHPLAIRVNEEIGIDISRQTSKPYDQFLEDPFDYVIFDTSQSEVNSCPLPVQTLEMAGLVQKGKDVLSTPELD